MAHVFSDDEGESLTLLQGNFYNTSLVLQDINTILTVSNTGVVSFIATPDYEIYQSMLQMVLNPLVTKSLQAMDQIQQVQGLFLLKLTMLTIHL